MMCVVTALVTGAERARGPAGRPRGGPVHGGQAAAPRSCSSCSASAAISGEVLATQAVAAPDWTQAVLLLIFAYGGFEAAARPRQRGEGPAARFRVRAARRPGRRGLRLHARAAHGGRRWCPTWPRRGAGGGGVRGPARPRRRHARHRRGHDLHLGLDGRRGAGLPARPLLDGRSARELPPILARVHPRFRTPDVAIYVFAAAGLAFALSGGFAANATISAIIRLVTYAMVCSTVPLFRRRPAMERARLPDPRRAAPRSRSSRWPSASGCCPRARSPRPRSWWR